MAALIPTAEELAIYDDISHLALDIWEVSKTISGRFTDPKMMSVVLFKRLSSNHQGFTSLWNSKLYLEADIILRSGVEAAICIAANFSMRDDFIMLMRQDAAYTLRGHIKLYREDNDTEMVSDAEAHLHALQSTMPEHLKPDRLNWKKLADAGGQPILYNYHRHLSSVSSHVTGASVLRGVIDDEGGELDAAQKELKGIALKMHLMIMAGATLHGSLLHSGMIENVELVERPNALINQLNALSMEWLGVERATESSKTCA